MTRKKSEPVPNPDARTQHIPVLLEPVLQYLKPQAGDSYLDLTAGYGGHAREILARSQSQQAVLVDRDSNAITALQKVFAGSDSQKSIKIVQSDFYSASTTLQATGQKFDMILADLGVSSPHLNVAERGFAITAEGPLDMRMDQTQPLTAADIVNSYSTDALADILDRFGEEPKSRHIARLIVESRKNHPISTTTELADIVSKAWPGHSKTHPATRSFQALRIAVNDELRLLQDALPVWLDLLEPAGRLVVISFHSLEDRIVKQAFADRASYAGSNRYDTDFTLLTKRPVTASQTELVSNPRARSAKLRAVSKQK